MIPGSEAHGSGEPQPAGEPALINECQQGAFRAVSLSRLTALARLRALAHAEQGADARLHRQLVDRAIFSVYEDCVAAGAQVEAQEILSSG